jgi:hypothetical protein
VYDGEDKIQMLAISPLTTASLSFSQHLLEIRAGAVWELQNCEMVLLNRRMCAKIQCDNASKGATGTMFTFTYQLHETSSVAVSEVPEGKLEVKTSQTIFSCSSG